MNTDRSFLDKVCSRIARPGVHRENEHKSGKVGERGGGPGDRYSFLFQWLTHHLQDTLLKFRQFIEKENAVMGEGDFARFRDLPSSE